MTRQELENEVLAHGFDAQKYRERVRRWLNEGVRYMRRNAELPEAEAEQTLATVAGTSTYVLDEEVVRVRWLRDTADHSTLEEWDLRDVDESGEASGKPYAFAFTGRSVVLYPTPDAVYALELRHLSSTTEMVDDDAEPALPEDYHRLPVSYALTHAYLSEDDAEMSAVHWNVFTRDFLAAKGDLQNRGRNVRQIPGMWAARRGPTFARP